MLPRPGHHGRKECGFENYYPICEPGQRGGCANASDFVRNTLRTGLRLEADYAVNPFKFGFIASTDDHQSLGGATDEDDFTTKPVKFAMGGGLDVIGQTSGGWRDQPDGGNIGNPGGLAGVWAEANTRDAIFDALRRRETFGNSGTRIHVRFFAGWDFPADLCAAELSTTWIDPDFDPALRAFYYVRALENPTCRWTTRRALARGVEPPPSDPPTVKERAWSSPIWYTPAAP